MLWTLDRLLIANHGRVVALIACRLFGLAKHPYNGLRHEPASCNNRSAKQNFANPHQCVQHRALPNRQWKYESALNRRQDNSLLRRRSLADPSKRDDAYRRVAVLLRQLSRCFLRTDDGFDSAPATTRVILSITGAGDIGSPARGRLELRGRRRKCLRLFALPGKKPGHHRKADTRDDGDGRQRPEGKHNDLVPCILVHVALHSSESTTPTRAAGCIGT